MHLPKWLIDEHAITIATWGLVFVTLFLDLVTLILWFDSLKKGKEQRERWALEDKQRQQDRDELRARWEREDAQSKEEKRPKYDFGIGLDDEGTFFWITNIGITSFLVKTVFLNRKPDTGSEFLSSLVKWNEAVPTGSKRLLRFDRTLFLNIPSNNKFVTVTSYECTLSCSVVGVDGRDPSETMKEFSIFADENNSLSLIQTTDY